MKHRELTRRYLEALVVAQAIVDPPLAEELLERIDPLCVSPAVITLLTGIAADSEAVEIWTAGQRELAECVDAITVRDLRGVGAYKIDTLVALLNQLPQRRASAPAWERDLATRAQESAA